MSEGSLGAPTRHAIKWQDEAYYDQGDIYKELERVFDICHGCRRCFNLCDSFPRLFDMIDDAPTGELDSVDKSEYAKVVDACTLCDMCFLTKCPYVPPHEFDLDFPHLMLRYRAQQFRAGKTNFNERQMTKTDRNGAIGCRVSGLANWATKTGNALTRPVMQAVAGIDKAASLPAFADKPLTAAVKDKMPTPDQAAPAHGRKAVLYASCYGNFNNTDIGFAAVGVLAKNGVQTEVIYPACCGMPQLEHGDIASVAASAAKVAAEMKPWIDQGYDIVAPVASCALMLKFEWPLILPDNEDVRRLAAATFDVTEYVVDIAKKEGLAEGLSGIEGGITVHISCHSRAQNMGQKANELLKLLPDTEVTMIERCAGHGGTWGVMKGNFDVALKVGKPVARKAVKAASRYVVSECPLARDHILQGMDRIDGGDTTKIEAAQHPIQVIARAYGL